MEEQKVRKPWGFQAWDPEKHRLVAAMGGRAVKNESRTFTRNPEIAAAAGRKGGITRAARAKPKPVPVPRVKKEPPPKPLWKPTYGKIAP